MCDTESETRSTAEEGIADVRALSSPSRKPLTVTEPAARQIMRLLGGDSGVPRLRIELRRSGCAGFSCTLNRLDEPRSGDAVYHLNGIVFHLSPGLLPLLEDATLDYVQRGLSSEFRFSGPRMGDTCGCGKSFRPLDE